MYITIAIVLAILALACLVFSVVSVMGSFFANPDVETKQSHVSVVNCIEEESEEYIVNAIWI